MYLPSHFEEKRPEVLHELMLAHPLGLLITQGESGLQANPIPFVWDADPAGGPGVLRAHVARANPVWREARTDTESLVVFQGPQAYISPGWYASKALHGKVVPTWNYCTVQGRGLLRVIDDAAWVHAFVTRLTQRHEASQTRPWAVSDAPADFIEATQRAIVGIEITLTALVGKWKTSQNRSAADRDGVARGLAQRSGSDAADMAALVAGSVKP
ncbi:MAG: FMN-binding negative transcriptional regulator [Burkholderiaceae bacterium]